MGWMKQIYIQEHNINIRERTRKAAIARALRRGLIDATLADQAMLDAARDANNLRADLVTAILRDVATARARNK